MSKEGLYIMMFSVHGLVRGSNLEMGRDADTGGQIKYVVELAKALSAHERVRKVDLFTRLVDDKTVSEDYSCPVEKLSENGRIVRVQCGGKKYMRKELLWPHLGEFTDRVLKFIKKEKDIPDLVHGHYADAGYVAAELSMVLGLPFCFTGHSLGRSKLAKLLNEGLQNDDIVRKYKIDHRIASEENILKNADLVVTSTSQEVKTQYGQYENKGITRYKVIPPGIDLEKFYHYHRNHLAEKHLDSRQLAAKVSISEELNRFFINSSKPVVLTLCRPDQRKNISGLIKTYGEDLELQAMANLAIFAGIRKDISEMEENERDVLTEMLLLMDKYDLYGKMAIPKKHNFEYEVPELYRIVAENHGVFINAAFTEPFGLTLIEASASGLPIVSTDDGGPRDIISNLQNGILVNVRDTRKMSEALKKILADSELWKTYSQNGIINVEKYYSWDAHVDTYISEIEKMPKSKNESPISIKKPEDTMGKRLISLNHLLITDIDYTLIGKNNESLGDLCRLIESARPYLGFGVATGRTIESASQIIEEYKIPHPDFLITSVGTEIYYGKELTYDQGYDAHISKLWNRDKIVDVLKAFDFLIYQEDDTQRKFKVSYYMEPDKDRLAMVHNTLVKNKLKYNLIYSHDQFLDILPVVASKGKAIRYLSYKWEIPLRHMVVSGDSGNDEEMLRSGALGVVVGNYSAELEHLKGNSRIFFAEKSYAGGILEGIAHYDTLEKANIKD